MKLIIGLGNPGKEYEKTRHNTGFWAVEKIAKKLGVEFKIDKKFNSELAKVNEAGEKIILVKPLTFMNNSGEAILKISDFYKVTPDNIIIFCDDTYLPVGFARIRFAGGSGGHNGLESAISTIGPNFYRVRIGVGEQGSLKLEDYVLQKMPTEDFKIVERTVDIVTTDMIDSISQKKIENKSYQVN